MSFPLEIHLGKVIKIFIDLDKIQNIFFRFLKASKIFFGLLILFAAPVVALFFLPSCAPREIDSQKPGWQVKVPWYDRSKDAYTFQTKTLNFAQDLKRLSSEQIQFFRFRGSLSDRYLFTPQLKLFFDREGVFIPTDEPSTKILSIFAYLEELSVKAQSLGVLADGKKISVFVNYMDSRKAEIVVGDHQNQAQYVSSQRAFIFYPYSADQLPQTLNPGVVGHEFFHFLIDVSNFGNLPQKLKTAECQFNEAVLESLEEAIADLWGFNYSGDPHFFQKSYPHQKGRELDGVEQPGQLAAVDQLALQESFFREEALGRRSGFIHETSNLWARRIYWKIQSKKYSSVEISKKLFALFQAQSSPILTQQQSTFLDLKRLEEELNFL